MQSAPFPSTITQRDVACLPPQYFSTLSHKGNLKKETFNEHKVCGLISSVFGLKHSSF